MRSAASIRPTTLGVKGLLLFAALELAFLATDYSNLFFLLLAFSAVLGLFGAWWSWRNLSRLVVKAVHVEVGPADASQAVEVKLAASTSPSFEVAVLFDLDGDRLEAAHAPMARGVVTISGAFPARPRGVACGAAVLLRSRYPFGLFQVTTQREVSWEIVTHPVPTEPPGATSAAEGRGAATLPDVSGTDVSGLREFRTGDSANDVHWKATARRGVAVVRERERDARRCIDVYVDRTQPKEQLEAALCRATGAVLAAHPNARVRLRSQGFDLMVGASREGAVAALRWLAAAKSAQPTSGGTR